MNTEQKVELTAITIVTVAFVAFELCYLKFNRDLAKGYEKLNDPLNPKHRPFVKSTTV